MKNRITNNNIASLKENEVFVFGSNSDGNHAGGAARLAQDKFGAINGVSYGLQGNSFGINSMSGLETLSEQANSFISFAKENSQLTFFVTEIGCGIAGYAPKDIAPLFSEARGVKNIHLPESFWDIVTLVKGYKVTNPDFSCSPNGIKTRYEIGKEFIHKGKVKACESGFHFCPKINHCFNYYTFDKNNRVFEVEAYGEMDHEGDKIASEKLKFIREIPWSEVLELANSGSDNTGHSNTGYSNTGYRNTGNWNTGNWNTGDRNTGYSNTGNWNTGAFCTGEAPFPIFNKLSDWTESKFKESKAYSLQCQIETKMWVPSYQMTEEEKEKHPSHKTAEGFLKDIPFKESFQNAWHNWSDDNRESFKDLPNFDADIFFEITGVRV